MSLEKELTDKNSKIYQLEMISLKANRLSPQAAKSDRVRHMLESNGYRSYEMNSHKLTNGNGTGSNYIPKRSNNNNNNNSFKK